MWSLTRLQLQAIAPIHAQVLAAADVSFDPALPLCEQLLGLFLPVPVGRRAGVDGVGAAVQQPTNTVR
jgi:hypothetical protein